jgi:hypothetical protein
MPKQTINKTIKRWASNLNLTAPRCRRTLNLKHSPPSRTDDQTADERYAGVSILREPRPLPTLASQNVSLLSQQKGACP